MTNTIVTLSVTQTVAATPSKLQATGAFISQGATITAAGTKTLLTQLSDLSTYLTGSKAITSITQTAGLATVTATVAHGLTIGDTLTVTISGSTVTAYNGTFVATVTTTTAFTYAVPSGTATPATGTVIYTIEDVTELTQMNTTFFAQGSNQAVYVLELGAGNVADGTTYLTNWIAQNPGIFYLYLVPRTWDAAASYLTLLSSFEGLSAKTYFFTTTTLATWTKYLATQKSCMAYIEAPVYGTWLANVLTAVTYASATVTATTTTAHGVSVGDFFSIAGVTPTGYNGTFQALTGTTGNTLVYALATNPGAETVLGTLVASVYASTGIPTTEFTAASYFYWALNYKPSTSNKVTPSAFSFLYDVTQFPTQGNSSLLSTLKDGNINIVGSGAEGGISDAILLWGKMLDGRQFTYWYSVDWAQINVDLDVANEVINGSNNPSNPLYYNQPGIDRLQQRAASTMSDAISFGMASGTIIQTNYTGTGLQDALAAGTFSDQIVINAVPFITYLTENTSDYATGTYDGFTIIYITQNGFISILFNLNVTDFVATS